MGIVFRRETAETERLVTFSDGILAIAISLLVLDIPVADRPAGGIDRGPSDPRY